jgi:hypothetical protein
MGSCSFTPRDLNNKFLLLSGLQQCVGREQLAVANIAKIHWTALVSCSFE